MKPGRGSPFVAFHITPEGNEQIACERDDANSSEAATAVTELALKPCGQCAVRLVTDPAPGERHHHAPHVRIACVRDALIVRRFAVLIRCRHQADRYPQPCCAQSAVDETIGCVLAVRDVAEDPRSENRL